MLKQYLKEEIEDKIEIDLDKHGKSSKIYKLFHNHQTKNDYNKTYFINFNYTSKKIKQYVKWLKDNNGPDKFPIEPIQIHGDLEGKDNPIIFGYKDNISAQQRKKN
ncbi:hypothetical protein [uncultured Cyclobacterium sp.]|uniref:hypothetical protein n=1 Tax=uncultured Cyclobacterium sp. TaxID=453820 RepID=UPI0030EF1798|tara:strand:- start:1490 stop:1807 length:318 start_codon:yes stop_codon:yes gene_type:complete